MNKNFKIMLVCYAITTGMQLAWWNLVFLIFPQVAFVPSVIFITIVISAGKLMVDLGIAFNPSKPFTMFELIAIIADATSNIVVGSFLFVRIVNTLFL